MSQAASVRECAARRFAELYDELRSRSWAANWGLPPCDREEAVQEACCYAWTWLLSATEKGRIDKLTAYSMARYARLLFRSGRRFAGSSSTDALGESTRAQGRTKIVRLEDLEDGKTNASLRACVIAEALTDSRRPRPDEQTRTEYDFGLVRQDSQLSDRARQVFERLLLDHEHGHGVRIADELGVSPPRICQIKRDELALALARIGYAPARPAA